MYTLYWICSPEHTDYNSQGYVGITNNFDRRMKEHLAYPNAILKNVIAKYTWDKLVKQPLAVNLDEELVLLAEEMLRPNDQIGWNITKGGGKPPKPTGKQAVGNKSRTGLIKYQIKATKNNVSLVISGKNGLKQFGFTPEAVYKCLNGKQSTHQGYRFEKIPPLNGNTLGLLSSQ